MGVSGRCFGRMGSGRDGWGREDVRLGGRRSILRRTWAASAQSPWHRGGILGGFGEDVASRDKRRVGRAL